MIEKGQSRGGGDVRKYAFCHRTIHYEWNKLSADCVHDTRRVPVQRAVERDEIPYP